MQDRYVGDVGDFGKFGLLRALGRASPRARVGVAWCRYPDECHNGDGRHITYLARRDFATLDPVLHSRLGEIVKSGQRSLTAVERARILPSNTIYFGDATRDAGKVRPSIRLNYRNSWLERALRDLELANLVFFDPDNGIEPASVRRDHPKAGKYVFWEDLLPFWQRGQSLVVYHHLNRTASARAQAEALSARFVENLGDIPLLAPLLFRRGSCRFFFIAVQEEHASAFRSVTKQFLSLGWNRHFEVVGTDGH